VQLLVVQASAGAIPLTSAVVTLVLALGCAVRYWWVILLLPWPARWPRMVLLLLAWSVLPVVAVTAASPVRWALAIAGLSVIGCVTELYNGITRQWAVGSERMARSLRRDHVSGALSTAMAAAIVVIVAASRPAWLELLIPLMVCADWVRLIVMIRRHQHLLDLENAT
jgi:hypothetical protein